MSDDSGLGLIAAMVAEMVTDEAAKKLRWVRWLKAVAVFLLILLIGLAVALTFAYA
jgi:hypothetical protein